MNAGNRKTLRTALVLLGVAALAVLAACPEAAAQTTVFPIKVNLGIDKADSPQDFVMVIQLVLLLTVLTLAPSIVIMMTSFTRISIIFGFARKAIGTQTEPSNQIMVGLSLFLTFFLMAPVFNEIKDKALEPYMKGTITQEAAFTNALEPLRHFMLKHTRKQELEFFVQISKLPPLKNQNEVPTSVVIPAFIISELTTAFKIGFVLYLPFLLIDMVIASVLMSMGMMMLPPVMISMPFKILLFVLVDGWYLLTKSIITSF